MNKKVFSSFLIAEYEAFAQRRAELQAAEAKLQLPVKKQVRLPVVVVDPEGNVEYGRAESRFFPSRKVQTKGDSQIEAKLPETPPRGAYYIEG